MVYYHIQQILQPLYCHLVQISHCTTTKTNPDHLTLYANWAVNQMWVEPVNSALLQFTRVSGMFGRAAAWSSKS